MSGDIAELGVSAFEVETFVIEGLEIVGGRERNGDESETSKVIASVRREIGSIIIQALLALIRRVLPMDLEEEEKIT